MKHLLIALLLLAMLLNKLCAQTAINSGFGTVVLEGGYLLDFSIGEMSNVATIQSKNAGLLQQITQGFLQPQDRVSSKSRVEIAPISGAILSPNPATDWVQLHGNWATSETASCNLLDATGKVVWVKEILGNNTIIPLSSFTSGIYFLKIAVAGKSETHRLVKTN